jgi:hypothetical protein
MPVTATSYEAQVSAAIVTMLAACASWTGGRSQIAEDWGDQDGRGVDGGTIDQTKTWAITRTQGVQETTVAAWTVVRSGPAEVVICSRPAATDKPAEAVRRSKNLAGELVDQMRAQLGLPGCLLHATFDVGESAVTDPGSAGNDDGDRPRELETTITIRWSEIP